MPYRPHEVAGELPEDNTVIWRFMSLPKFLSIVTRNCLYFCQLDHLRRSIDPFEGTLSKLDLEFFRRVSDDQEFARRALKLEGEPSKAILEALSPDVQKQTTNMAARIAYVNCWNMCEYESAFLWSVYASHGDGIAIRSNIGKLKSALEKEPRALFIGKVKYTDFEREHVQNLGNFMVPIFHKRKSFEAEQELRICFLEDINQVISGIESIGADLASGVYVSVGLAELIDEVYMSPTSPDWYSEAVVATMRAMGLRLSHQKSSLSSPAIF